ncbi:MAG: MFS transporter [Propionibacteriaceae bacterium]
MNIMKSREARLAIALLAIELIAGMQTYLLALVVPQIAADLDAKKFFGLLSTAAAAAAFITMPLGVYAVRRWSTSKVLLAGTLVVIAGASLSAVANNVWIFAGGRIISGLAGGILASVSMSAVITNLDKRWRQLVLAGFSAMWVISSLVGPTYGALVSRLWSWRVALVLYLPVLLAARWVVSRNLGESSNQPESETRSLRSTLALSVLLFVGIVVVSASSGLSGLWFTFLCAGVVTVSFAVFKLLPSGVFAAKRGRHSAILLLFMICGIYLGADSIMAIAASEALSASSEIIAVMLMASGLAWALLGMWMGIKPASSTAVFHRRALIGASLLVIGFSVVAAGILGIFSTRIGLSLTVAGAGCAGTGMGFIYLDTLNAVFEEPAVSDGINDEIATATVLAESVSATLFTAVCSAIASVLVVSGHAAASGYIFVGLAVLSLLLFPVLLRVASKS